MAALLLQDVEEYKFSTIDPKFEFVPGNAISDTTSSSHSSKQLVFNALQEHVKHVDHNTCEPGEEDAFFVADLGHVYRQQMRWKRGLGRVKPHYAVKCNPDPQVLRLLDSLGTGFDCASKAELDAVLRIGVHPSRIIYAQPCKTASFVRYAADKGVKQMTFDNSDELYKIKRFFPDSELFLRILTDDSASLCRLSLKFGAALDVTESLLLLAKDLDLNVVGVAFHVGSGASDPAAFNMAIRDARHVFDQATEIGFKLTTLDIGGGFVSSTFESMASVLSTALEDNFPPNIRVIGEPGRFYVSSAFTIACHVIARRAILDPETQQMSYMLYLNDGVYGNFSSIMFDHQHPTAQVLRCAAKTRKSTHHTSQSSNKLSSERDASVVYSIWGPTCDGIDCITPLTSFPISSGVLDVGDWLFFEEMGAYTRCSATRFNGFTDSHKVVYVSSESAVAALLS